MQQQEGRSLKEIKKLIQQWLRYLLSKRLFVLCITLFGTLAGLSYAWWKKPQYKAELIFALEDQQSTGGLSGALGLASQFGFDLGGSAGGAFSGDNLQELLKSRPMVERALLKEIIVKGKKEVLADRYMRLNALDEKWKAELDLPEKPLYAGSRKDSLSLLQDSLLDEIYDRILKNELAVEKKDKKLSIVTVQTTTTDPLFSKYFTEFLVKEVSDFYIDTKTKKSANNVAVLQRQTDSVRQQLNKAIEGVAFSTDVNPNPNSAFQSLRVPSQRRQVDVQANSAILSELVKNLEVAKVALRKETPLIQVIDYPKLPLKQKKPGKLFCAAMGTITMLLLGIMTFTLSFSMKEEEAG